MPGLRFILSMTLHPEKRKTIKTGGEAGAFSDEKTPPKKRDGGETWSFQQQLSHPDPSESFHCILTASPKLCLEKHSGDLTEIHIGIFVLCLYGSELLLKV